ncbi:V-type proton ATPase subunit E [Dolichospermum sp. ST_sed5]|nr:V-type proton ATPase subunit E [Dolichospermum sp. ST_sed5]
MSLLAGITSPKNVSAQVSNIILGNGSQCGLSISGGYSRQENKSENFPSNNNNNNNIFQIVTTLNTNPCANQRDLEIIRQDSEKQREIIRQDSEKQREIIRQDSEKQREIIRQDNEKQREAMRTYSQIINTCINARSQAIQKEINPDVICNLRELVSELSNFSPILNSK